ncbi:penicillin-binding protein, partial [Candidatus Amesbacteria bacterium]|nr:penicillin-binding protein [Candidatus Amesbacteria bacterium]
MPKRKVKSHKSKIKISESKKIHQLQKKHFLILSCAFAFCLLSFYFFWDLPNPMNLTRRPSPASTRLLDRHGRLIYEIYESQRRTPVPLSSLPKHLIDATLAAEDKDFYSHSGFSIRGITRAFINTFFKRSLQGGSTITQQLVKNALLTSDRTVRRKVREFTLSVLVELFYKKDQILELYLNQVPYGGTAYGIEAAAQTYFGKSSRDLTLPESALLAGLPQAPSYYSPFGSHPELAKDRKNYVLKQMLDNRIISESDYSSSSAKNLTYSPPPAMRAPHFSLWIKDLLINKYGLHIIEQEGLTVTTTLDLDLQDFVQNVVATETAKLQRELVGNGAALVTLPKTGEILAMVGSRDYFDIPNDGNVNVVLASRQPGSSIKPVNYALAFEHRLLTPGTL